MRKGRHDRIFILFYAFERKNGCKSYPETPKRQFFAAPVFEDEEVTRSANLLNVILIALFAAGVMGGIVIAALTPTGGASSLAFGGIMAAASLGLWFLMRSGRVQLSSVLLSAVLWVGITFQVYSETSGLRGPITVAYFMVVTVAGLLLGF